MAERIEFPSCTDTRLLELIDQARKKLSDLNERHSLLTNSISEQENEKRIFEKELSRRQIVKEKLESLFGGATVAVDEGIMRYAIQIIQNIINAQSRS